MSCCRMQFYINLHDVQTIAMLCCVFWNRQQIINPPSIQKSASKSSLEFVPPNVSIYNTRLGRRVLWGGDNSAVMLMFHETHDRVGTVRGNSPENIYFPVQGKFREFSVDEGNLEGSSGNL